ncbi:hypothetical protein SALBM311S_04840 [Streptomyces alboniger]
MGNKRPSGATTGRLRAACAASRIIVSAWSRWPARAAVYDVVHSIWAYAERCASVCSPVASTLATASRM